MCLDGVVSFGGPPLALNLGKRIRNLNKAQMATLRWCRCDILHSLKSLDKTLKSLEKTLKSLENNLESLEKASLNHLKKLLNHLKKLA